MRPKLHSLAAVLLLLACGDKGTTPTGPGTPPPTRVATSITMSPTSLSLEGLGQTSQLSATVKDQNGATMSGATVSWVTSAASVVTVSSTGLVTAVAIGTATVTATSGSAKATAPVSVTQVATSVTLTPNTLNFVSQGDTATLSASVKDAGGTVIADVMVEWSTSDSTIVTISSGGLVTSIGNGTATVTAASGAASSLGDTTQLTDTVSSRGDTRQLTGTTEDVAENEINAVTVTWATSNSPVATVSSGGLATAVTNATDTAASGMAKGTAAVTVTQVVVSITLSDPALSFTALGDTTRLTARGRDANDSTIVSPTVSWATSDTLVATISAEGLVTSVSNGSATITATSAAATDTATITVAQMAANIELTDTVLRLFTLGDTTRLTATVKDSNDSTMASATVNWDISDALIATISAEGLVTSVSNGSATITATSGEAIRTAAVTIAQLAASVALSDTVLTFSSLGSTTQLTAIVRDANDSTIASPALSWATSDALVATVSSAGLVTSVANGSVTIVTTSDAASDTATVTIAQVVASVALSDTVLTFSSLGSTTQLTATVRDANDSTIASPALGWATSDALVATISEEGLVTSVGEGIATITASFRFRY